MKKDFLVTDDRKFKTKPLAIAIRTLLASGLAIGAGVQTAQAELPVPSNPVTLSTMPVDIASQGFATATVTGNAMTINQSTDKASIDWQSFNIDAGSSVTFEQPSPTAVALNNIHQQDASRIMGSLTANGQVYLVNQNGFVFGANSQINVNSLVATTLGVSEVAFKDGLTRAFTKENNYGAALAGNGEAYIKDQNGNFILDPSGNKIKIEIFIEKGAHIRTNATSGRVIIAAPVVNNAGTVETPDGQALLVAATDKVYLQEANSDSDIRGLLVEVGTGGKVTNTGEVLAERGNASLMGFAVNQNGKVSASTSVSLNGSVRLLAREGIQDPSGSNGKLLPKATIRAVALDDGLGTKATVHLGGGSHTRVTLDTTKDENGNDLTAIAAQAQSRSKIEVNAHDVYLHNKSTLQAKSGHIAIATVDDPTDSSIKGDARIFLESGSVIDASGVKNAKAPMEQNVVTVELRKNELRDAPWQRDGILYGKKVNVDIRHATLNYDADHNLVSATVPIADIKGAVDRIAYNIEQRSTSGGTVNLTSSGDVVTQTGSKIDFSGGSVAYQDGFIETTTLQANGRLYDIASADPNRHYTGILGQVSQDHPKWGVTEMWDIPGLAVRRFESGYIEGKAGGTLNISAYATQLNGSLDGSTIVGTLQRNPDEHATGSHFALDLVNGNLLGKQDIVFNKDAQLTTIGFKDRLPTQENSTETAALILDAHLFKGAGISHVSLKTNGNISLQKDASLALPVNGSLTASASQFAIQGSIVAPSGEVTLAPVDLGTADEQKLQPTAITLGSSALIDVSGLWVNDVLDAKLGRDLGVLARDGGNVSLASEQGDLRLERGSRIDVSGGAQLDNHARVHAGKAGGISLTAATHEGGGKASSLILNGDLAAWGINEGGSLSINTNEVVIGNASDAPVHKGSAMTPLILSPEFFQQGGFADYQLTANTYGLKIADNVQLNLQQKNRVLDDPIAGQATGSELENFSTVATLPDTDRHAMSLSLAFNELLSQNRQEALRIGKGTLIQTDAGGSVSLSSDTSVFIDGTITTPGGTITVDTHAPTKGDKGFYAAQGIWLGGQSRLLAKGVYKPTLNDFGLKTGDVLSGGTITLAANRGYLVTRAGSLINVSGTSEKLDFQQPLDSQQHAATGKSHVIRQTIASDGGTISLHAGEGLLADGRLKAHSGGLASAGGKLDVLLSPKLRNKPAIDVSNGLFPDDMNTQQPITIEISADDHAAIPKNLKQGGNIASAQFSGRAFLGDGPINSAGFDSVSIKTDTLGANGKYVGTIQFNGDVHLAAARQIVLDAPILQTTDGNITLDTAYAKLGATGIRETQILRNTLAAPAKTGLGAFTTNAQGIDLIGGLSFSGFKQVNLSSENDVRMIGIQGDTANKNYRGELKVAGDLTIAASQLYPATLTDYKISVGGTGGETVTLKNSGNTAGPAYSADGKLTIAAPNIVQAGTVKVPFGSLALNASEQLTLTDGSLTSVSGDGLTVLFGQGSGGLNWLYPLDLVGGSNIVIGTPPEKHITLNGKTVALNSGATVNLSGGGDLYAYEFITGPGGSHDVLEPTASGYTQKFAVIPSLGNALTPYDPHESVAADVKTGDSVYLGAGSGLAAGWYTLLPARYALLPGAYLVTPQANTQDLVPGQTFVDLAGTHIVAGRYGVASANTANARWQGFAVESGAMARTRSQYTDYSANHFFTAKAAADGTVVSALPRDAGSLAIITQTGLSLGAQLSAAPADKGRGGQVDISADRLAIVGRREDVASEEPGVVTLLAEDLNQFNAPSLLLGGLRSKTASGQRVSVAAQNLTIKGDAVLQGEEILLAAKDTVQVKSGAVVESTGKNTREGIALQVSNQGDNTSDSALLRLSAAAQADAIRDKTVTGNKGTLIVETGARLKSAHSMLLDSTQNTLFDGDIDMQGGSLALTASNISLGPAPVGTSGLVLAATQFTLDELQLNSRSDIDLYGGVTINTGLLNINAAHINGFNNTGTSTALTANTIKLGNTNAVSASNGSGDGSLALNAEQIELGSGSYAINGFSNVNLNATTAIKGVGQLIDKTTGQSVLAAAGKLTVAADLHLNAGHFIGDAGATTSIDASGHPVDITALGADNPAWTNGLGASWAITGDAITSNGRFDLPSGILKLTALQGDIVLNGGSRLDVSGRTVTFDKHDKFSTGGTVSLSADAGDISLADGASINVAGGASNGRQQSDAGLLAVQVAQGQFNWNGNITALNNALANSDLKQGKFRLDTKTFGADGFSVLNSKLATAGFSEALRLQQRQGDVTIAASDTVNAHHFSLLADQGKVVIDGTVNASGGKAGAVDIYGRNGITVGSTGKLLATASNTKAEGGIVTLDTVHRDDTGSGLLDLAQTGGEIDVSGGAGGNGGAVHLRTGRDDILHTINVTNINTHIKGADTQRTALEATRVYEGQTTIKTADITKWRQDTENFMANAPTLANFSGTQINVMPGLDIRSTGDLTLAKPWDLLGWRYADAQADKTLPGFLTLRAGGDLKINATLTDGFADGAIPGVGTNTVKNLLQPGQSWTYHLLAKNDVKLNYGTGPGLSEQVMVRTGTGNIGIEAGGDITFVANKNDPSAAAAVYTMGKPADYTLTQLLKGEVPGVPAKNAGETDTDYLNRLDPRQMDTLLRYGYLTETQLGGSRLFRYAEYPNHGGSIAFNAGGTITGINTGQKISEWLDRSGIISEDNRATRWGINISNDPDNGSRYFNQNIGALGGGNVTIDAGGDIANLSVMLPTTGKPFGKVSTAKNQWLENGVAVNGGGDLQVTAGNHIVGGEYFVGKGTGQLNAGGSVARSSGLAAENKGATLDLGDGSFTVQSRQDTVINSVLNPTILDGDTQFFTYSPSSAINLAATAGNIILQNNLSDALTGFTYNIYPGSLSATALSGDIRINNSLSLMPSAQGEFTLLAARNIGIDTDAAQIININMSDADPVLLPSVNTAVSSLLGTPEAGDFKTNERLNPDLVDSSQIHANTPIHAGDTRKPTLIAKSGDIGFSSNAVVTFFFPQAAEFIAGRDINNLSFKSQNLSVDDVTRVTAGRDIRFDAAINDDGIVQSNTLEFQLGGPGQIQIQAGRNISLGGSEGINTIGNTKNTVLSAAGGASINLLAGINGSVDYAGFIKKYFGVSSAYLKNLSISDDNGNNVVAHLTPEQKLAYLEQLSGQRQQKILLDVLFNEIKLSAAAAAAVPEAQRKPLYQQGFDAIAALFPDQQYQGDVSLVFSQIKTLAGGGINLAVPGGAVNVGLAGKVGGISKAADKLGIVAQQTGDVNSVSLGDFNVNQSRVFTMGGGDIAIWSSKGNIDAGKGAKSAISAPAPIISVDAKGNVITIFPPIVSGSGIQTINPQDKTKAQGNVYLAAPVGIIDAGEAGISGGKIVIAATAVVGASNISASGGSVGVPTAVTTPVVPSGAAGAAASAAKQATTGNEEEDRKTNDSDKKKTAVSLLSADVVGYGECSVADVRDGKKGCGG